MSLLKHITLQAIDQIFSGKKLGARAQMLYINCLIHHFRDKKATIDNIVAFDIPEAVIPLKKYKTQLAELQLAELIRVNTHTITFYNYWGQHINKSKLGLPDEKTVFDAVDFDHDLRVDSHLLELIQYKHRWSKEILNEMITGFIKEQMAKKKKYYSFGDCSGHFLHWANKNADKAPAKKVMISTVKKTK